MHTRSEKPSRAEVSLAEEVLASFVVFPRLEAGEALYLNGQKRKLDFSQCFPKKRLLFSITNIFLKKFLHILMACGIYGICVYYVAYGINTGVTIHRYLQSIG